MGMIANSMIDERESSVLTMDEIYDLIEKTMVGKSPKVRIRAITTLGNSGDPRAVRSLIDRLQGPEPGDTTQCDCWTAKHEKRPFSRCSH